MLQAYRPPLRRLGREALRSSALSRRSEALFLVVASIMLLAGGLYDAIEIRRIQVSEVASVSAGATTLVIQDSGGIDAAACEHLGGSEAAIAGGSMRTAGEEWRLRPSSLESLPVVLATAGMMDTLGVLRSADARAWRGAAARGFVPVYVPTEESGGAVGAHTENESVAAGQAVEVVGIASAGALAPETAGSYVVPAHALGMADWCAVVARPGAEDSITDALAAVSLSMSEDGRFVQRALTRPPGAASIDEQLAGRPSLGVWVAVVSGVLLSRMILVVRRRGEVGTYLVIGLRRSGVAQLRIVVAAINGLVFGTLTMVGLTVAMIVVTDLRSLYWPFFVPQMSAMVLVVVTAVGIVDVLGCLGASAISLVKD